MWIRAATLLFLAAALPAAGAKCDSAAWAFYGAVRDASGNPVGDAEVYLLLDKVNRADYLEKGVRGRRFRTNAFGKYQAGLICSDNSDTPNPCAKKLRHLTVMISAGDHAASMRVFKLDDLPIRREDGACMVHVPEVRLKRNY